LPNAPEKLLKLYMGDSWEEYKNGASAVKIKSAVDRN
jgi:hypothetical protein